MMMKTLQVSSAAILASLIYAPHAAAQNTGGVFPTQVNEGHKSLQYRAAIDPDNAQDEFGFAQRLHYQQAINGDFMWRIVGQTQKTESSDFDFSFLQAELFWELSDDEDQHKTGLRFDARLTDGDRAEQLGVNWMNSLILTMAGMRGLSSYLRCKLVIPLRMALTYKRVQVSPKN